VTTEPDATKAPEPAVEYRGTGFYVTLVGILVAAVLLLVLAVQNTQTVTLSFLGFDIDMPLFAVVVGAAIFAIVLDELVGLVWRARRRRRLSERAELQRLRSEGAPPQDEVEHAEATAPAAIDEGADAEETAG